MQPERHISEGVIQSARGNYYHKTLGGSYELSLASTWRKFLKGLEGADIEATKEDDRKAQDILGKLPIEMSKDLVAFSLNNKTLVSNRDQWVSKKQKLERCTVIKYIFMCLQYAMYKKNEALFLTWSNILPHFRTLISIQEKIPKKFAGPEFFENPRDYYTEMRRIRENSELRILKCKLIKNMHFNHMKGFIPICSKIVSQGIVTNQFYLVLVFIKTLSNRGFSLDFLDNLPENISSKLQGFVGKLFENIFINDATVMLSKCIENIPDELLQHVQGIRKKFPSAINCINFLNVLYNEREKSEEHEEHEKNIVDMFHRLQIAADSGNEIYENTKLFRSAKLLETEVFKKFLNTKPQLKEFREIDEFGNTFLHCALTSKYYNTQKIESFVKALLEADSISKFVKSRMFFKENKRFETPLSLLFLRVIESTSFDDCSRLTNLILMVYNLKPDAFFNRVKHCKNNPYLTTNRERENILHIFAKMINRKNHKYFYKSFIRKILVLFLDSQPCIKQLKSQESWNLTPLEVYKYQYNIHNLKQNKKLIKFFS